MEVEGGVRDLAISLKEACAMSQTFDWGGAEGDTRGMASEDDGETVAIQQQQDARTRLRGS